MIMKKEKSAAVLTINGASKMSRKGRAEIAAWLRHQANSLTNLGDKYSEGRFTARYLYS